MRIDGVETVMGERLVYTRASEFEEMRAVLGEPLATVLLQGREFSSENGVYVVTEVKS